MRGTLTLSSNQLRPDAMIPVALVSDYNIPRGRQLAALARGAHEDYC